MAVLEPFDLVFPKQLMKKMGDSLCPGNHFRALNVRIYPSLASVAKKLYNTKLSLYIT